MTHNNRNWQRRWTVDVEETTASHVDGWVFKFSLTEDGYDAQLIKQPNLLTIEQMMGAARIAKEAGEAWKRALERQK